MAKLKIQIFKHGAPAATITIPVWAVIGASQIISKLAGKQLQDHNIDIEQIVELIKNPQANGVVIDIEDHANHQKVVISLVREEETAIVKA
ncbi:MAG: hypothetical protein ACREC6_03405 [Hyphomicrobiaceae bacterium]